MANLDKDGMAARREVLGGDYVDASVNNADDFMMAFQELTTNHCWGACWVREGLSRRDRSLINVAMLAALGKTDELKLHVKGAINNGLTVEEIREALFQVGIYAGVPASLSGFKAAHATLKELGEL